MDRTAKRSVIMITFSIDQKSETYEGRVSTLVDMLSYTYGLYRTALLRI